MEWASGRSQIPCNSEIPLDQPAGRITRKFWGGTKMQKRLQRRREEHVTLPPEMSPVAQAAKALAAMMGWSKPPSSAPSETSPPASRIGPSERENPEQPSHPASTSKSDRPDKRLSEKELAELLRDFKRLKDYKSPQSSPRDGAKAPYLEQSTNTSTWTARIQVLEDAHRRSAEATKRALERTARRASQLPTNPKPKSKSERSYPRLSAEARDPVLSDFIPQQSSPAAPPSQTTSHQDSTTPSPIGPPPKTSTRVT